MVVLQHFCRKMIPIPWMIHCGLSSLVHSVHQMHPKPQHQAMHRLHDYKWTEIIELYPKVVVDFETILGSLGMRQEDTPGWYVSLLQGSMHTLTVSGNSSTSIFIPTCRDETRGAHRNLTRTSVAALPSTLLCHPTWNKLKAVTDTKICAFFFFNQSYKQMFKLSETCLKEKAFT